MEKKDRIKKDISRESYLQTVIRRFKQHHLATVSLVILAVLVVAALLAPIGISIAQSIGADPKPVLMAIGIAASMAFATPMATPPNTLVLGPGGFTFNDYVKVGLPLCIVTFIASVIIIPIFWPFFPA